MASFTKRLVELRRSRSLTQKEVANAISVPLSTYKEWEYGRRIQGEQVYVALADVFGVSLRRLLTGEKDFGKNETLEKIELAIRQMEEAKRSFLSSL